ncbi:hypothetical protein [Luteolibacter luteus]|jgi:cell division protein FtsB|uniref:Uncharacterized protein n=1 Tax=Luteolibacter luteus TaxID=2728835 RepID=A0A858RHE8_9BACT|nr:hypothetical protein [Luteolibacter luteus]QJE95974.1 hypothetical protein HHL09_09330 [Luteolibacter luteus]
MPEFINNLERLVGMGILPIVAILLLFVLGLAAVVAAMAGFGFKFFMGERRRHDALLAQRDKERVEERLAIETRLSTSEEKHEACEKDRDVLRTDVATLSERVDRLTKCPKPGCPMRLP